MDIPTVDVHTRVKSGAQGRRRMVLRLLSGLLVLGAGCVGGPKPVDTGVSPTPDTVSTKHPKLDSVLVRLANADDPSTFASNNGLELTENGVLVQIELQSGKALPSGYGVEVVSRNQELVDGYVPVDQLLPLAEHENVSYIRRPPTSQSN